MRYAAPLKSPCRRSVKRISTASLGHDAQASALLDSLPPSSVVEYLRAVASSRLGRKAEGREHFLRACELDSRMQFIFPVGHPAGGIRKQYTLR